MTQGQTDTLKKAFLKAFRDCGSVTAAATIAGLRTRKEHYRWLEIDQQWTNPTNITLKKKGKLDERRSSETNSRDRGEQ